MLRWQDVPCVILILHDKRSSLTRYPHVVKTLLIRPQYARSPLKNYFGCCECMRPFKELVALTIPLTNETSLFSIRCKFVPWIRYSVRAKYVTCACIPLLGKRKDSFEMFTSNKGLKYRLVHLVRSSRTHELPKGTTTLGLFGCYTVLTSLNSILTPGPDRYSKSRQL